MKVPVYNILSCVMVCVTQYALISHILMLYSQACCMFSYWNAMCCPETSHIFCNLSKFDFIIYLTAIGLTPGLSSTAHIYTQAIHRTMRQNTQNKTYITVRILKLT
jgi:hypothetical protein